MSKLLVLSIAFLVSFVHSQTSGSWHTISVGYLSELSSYYKSFQLCSYSSPAWVKLFVHSRFIIDTTFTEFKNNSAHPTYISSIRIRFHKIGSTLSETFVVPRPGMLNGNNHLFLRGPLPSTSWLKMIPQYFSSFPPYHQVTITDNSLGPNYAMQVIIQDTGSNFKIYVLAKDKNSFNRAGGLLIDGCPYTSVYPWLTGYYGNPNIMGRRKRQAEKMIQPYIYDDQSCNAVAEEWVKRLEGLKGIQFQDIYNSCVFESKFIKDAAKLSLNSLEGLALAFDDLKKRYPDDPYQKDDLVYN